MSLKVYAEKNSNLNKILIAAKYNGVNVDVQEFSAEVEKKNFLAEVAAKTVYGKVPVAETAEGFLFGANAVARYVAKLGKNKLSGSSAYDAGSVEQWIDFAATEIELPGAVWVYPILGLIPNNANATQKAKGDVRKALETLNKHLLSRTFLVGNRITLADIVVASSLQKLYELVLDTPFRKQFQNVNRWFTTVVHQPEFTAVTGEVKLAEKMQVAKEAPAAAPVKEEKKEQPKKEEKPKEEKKPKKEAEEEEEDYEAAEKKEKKPNPLDSLPPSKFVLDEWKRVYSNTDTRSEAIPWFWQNYDPEGYSIYFGKYKYNAELNKIFMTANLLGGFVQRLDPLRKYGFGALIILGEEPNLEIELCFLYRGQEIPAPMLECDDYECYNWEKADTNDTATREKINQFWAWDMPRFNQGKAFK